MEVRGILRVLGLCPARESEPWLYYIHHEVILDELVAVRVSKVTVAGGATRDPRGCIIRREIWGIVRRANVFCFDLFCMLRRVLLLMRVN
jgi:hypothetical protein